MLFPSLSLSLLLLPSIVLGDKALPLPPSTVLILPKSPVYLDSLVGVQFGVDDTSLMGGGASVNLYREIRWNVTGSDKIGVPVGNYSNPDCAPMAASKKVFSLPPNLATGDYYLNINITYGTGAGCRDLVYQNWVTSTYFAVVPNTVSETVVVGNESFTTTQMLPSTPTGIYYQRTSGGARATVGLGLMTAALTGAVGLIGV